MTKAIVAEGLKKRFRETEALRGIDFDVEQGTVLGLLGPNGAGKTTAVRILATLLAADEGHAEVAGFDVSTLAHRVRSVIGLTGQHAAVDEYLTGRENLTMIGRLLDMRNRDAKQRASDLLDRFGLSDAGDRLTKTYSGGMRRRLDLAASLVGRPAILFLDEPTTGLDPHSRLQLWGVIRELIADGTTLLLTTQYLEEADILSDDIVVIDHGEVIARGTPQFLKSQSGGKVLQVVPTDPDELPRLAELLAGFTDTAPTLDDESQMVCLTIGDDIGIAAAAIRRVDEAGVSLADLHVMRPSLDDVFLRLTGEKTREDQ